MLLKSWQTHASKALHPHAKILITMFTIISRIFHFGFKNFWRNGWLTTVTVVIMTLALFVFIGLILFNVVTSAAAASIQDKIDISVYFNTNTAEDEILNIQQSLAGPAAGGERRRIFPRARRSTFSNRTTRTTRRSARRSTSLTRTRSRRRSISRRKIRASTARSPTISTSPDLAQYIDSVSYTQNQDIIDRLAKIVKDVEIGGFVITLILTLIAGLVVFNTIRLAIYSNREEIGVMRVVGASNSLTRGPFVVEGMLCGAIAAVVALAIIAPVLYFINPYLNVFIPGLELFRYYYTHIFSLFLYALLFSVVVGGLSSFIAVRRYLKN